MLHNVWLRNVCMTLANLGMGTKTVKFLCFFYKFFSSLTILTHTFGYFWRIILCKVVKPEELDFLSLHPQGSLPVITALNIEFLSCLFSDTSSSNTFIVLFVASGRRVTARGAPEQCVTDSRQIAAFSEKPASREVWVQGALEGITYTRAL